MDMLLKLGSLPGKRYRTKEYDTIEVGDHIEIMVQGVWKQIKIWKLYDRIPVLYFGEYL